MNFETLQITDKKEVFTLHRNVGKNGEWYLSRGWEKLSYRVVADSIAVQLGGQRKHEKQPLWQIQAKNARDKDRLTPASTILIEIRPFQQTNWAFQKK